MLQCKNIIKDYVSGDEIVHALKGVSLSFREHEFVSILGQSGCGKTTFLNTGIRIVIIRLVLCFNPII